MGHQDDADEVLANELRHGVPLLLQREPVATEAADVSSRRGEQPAEPSSTSEMEPWWNHSRHAGGLAREALAL